VARYTLQLLGAPRLLEGDAERHLPSRRALALLACLAVEGRLTRARLAALFWGELDESAARRNLRRELARLRDAGYEATFGASDDKLELGADVSADLQAFEAAHAQGDIDAALALWRGPLLDGFALAEAPAFESWRAERREAVQRRWRAAAATAAARAEAGGDARAALDWQARLLADDPLQESHHAALMRLHHLLGERAAALEVFERCCRLLRDELGLDPLASTVALAESIRAAERLAPLVRRQADAALRRLDAPLVGRVAEAARLRASAASVLLVEGEAGVGKTRLVQDVLLARATFALRCEAIARDAALYPVAEAVRTALDTGGRAERLATLAPADRHEVARLLPLLADPAGPADVHEGGDLPAAGPAARLRFFDALAELLDRLAGPGGCLWIDDLHWADDSTLELLVHLAHRHARDPRAHLRVVAAARAQELDERLPARAALRGLERAGLLERLRLVRFDADETLELVRELSGSSSGTLFAARLQKATRGNPFYLLETVRFLFDSGELKLDASGAWSTRYDDATADYAELPVPPTVAATVVERVERLGAGTRRVLEAAALTRAGFTLAQVQPATALSDWEALDGLERAVQAELLVEFAPGYRFVHDLARDALAATLRPERRRLIHERLARTLIAQQARAELIALHLQGAGRPDEARVWVVAAAREAERLFAWRDALAQYEQALALGPAADEAVRIRLARVAVLHTLHDLAAMATELDALDTLASDLGDTLLALEVLARRTELGVRQHRYPDAIGHARRAWAHPAHAEAPAELRHRLIRDGAFALVENACYDEARAIYERELARAAEHPSGYLGALHHGMANYHTSFGDDALAKGHLEQAVDLFAAAGEDERRLRSLNILAYCQYRTGETQAAIASMQQALAEAERYKHVSLLRNTLLNFILYVLDAGDTERAQALLARAQELLAGVDDPATQCRLQIRVCEVAAQRGELGEAVAAARRAVALIEANGGGLPDFWPWFILARLLWWIGDRAGAVAVYRGLPESPAWLETAAPAVRFYTAAWALPDAADAALDVLANIEPASGVLVQAEVIAFFHALALHAAGRDDEALALLEPAHAGPVKLDFAVRAEDRLALRLQVRAALRLDTSAACAAARAALPVAAPLLQWRLHAALAVAFDAAGDTSAAQRQRADAAALAGRLAVSLADARALQERFVATHCD
jgi:DNA-binding SARP family transcriptional activator/predicted ATPase